MTDFFYDSWLMLLSFVLPGVLIGIVYDVFRILRIARASDDDLTGGIYDKLKPRPRLFKNKKPVKLLKITNGAIIIAEDILFWISAAVIETVFIYYKNNGEIRLGFFIVSALGFFAYLFTLGRLVSFLSRQIIFFCRCLIFWTLYIIIYPIRVVFGFIFKVFKAVCDKIKDISDENYSKRAMSRLLIAAESGFGYRKK